jgi:hypothetical protein
VILLNLVEWWAIFMHHDRPNAYPEFCDERSWRGLKIPDSKVKSPSQHPVHLSLTLLTFTFSIITLLCSLCADRYYDQAHVFRFTPIGKKWQDLAHWVTCTHSMFQTPIRLQVLFFLARPLFLLLIPLVITFCLHIVILFFTTINERTNERTNGNPHLLTSWSSFAYHY